MLRRKRRERGGGGEAGEGKEHWSEGHTETEGRGKGGVAVCKEVKEKCCTEQRNESMCGEASRAEPRENE